MKSNQPKRSFSFLRINEREDKPRKRGLTEIRGPYYSVVGRRYLEDLFETMGAYVDSLKFAGGSFTLMPERAVREIVDLCHKHDVLVSTGGFIERVLVQGGGAVRQYVEECKKIGFDIIEISAEGEAGSRHSVCRRWSDATRGVASRRHSRSELDHRAGKTISRCRR